MRRPAELDDPDRRWLTALPTVRYTCDLCGSVYDVAHACTIRLPLPPEAPVPASHTRRFARVRAASTATKFALLVAGVVLACLAVIAAAWVVGERWT